VSAPSIDPYIQEIIGADNSLERLGINVASAHAGAATLYVDVDEDQVNGQGVAHGGFIFALADTAFALAANSLRPGVVTSDADITYLAPVLEGQRMQADAQVRFAERRLICVEVVVTVEGRTVALFIGRGIARHAEVGRSST
jgi:acyl-CoA thioesterase